MIRYLDIVTADYAEFIIGRAFADPLADPRYWLAAAAIFLRQSRHRQSWPSTGFGSRALSSAHQHDPSRLQANSVPHMGQARRRADGISNRFVMNCSPSFSSLVHCL
jgi:hypothetical protein